jgi:hypothetical protein
VTSTRWPRGSRFSDGPVTRVRHAIRAGVAIIAVFSTSASAGFAQERSSFAQERRLVAQERNPAADEERDRAFIEALRREDPDTAARYTELREARRAAIAELQKVETRYAAAGPGLRPVMLPQLKDAQRRYAETSLAVLDFLDARDRRALARYEEEMGRIKALLEERARARADLEKMRRGE